MRMLYRSAAIAVVFTALAGQAAATPSLVVEVASGKVLFSEDATMPWHPASVTKLMTTYVALRMVKAGKLSLETPIPYSTRAASAPPSKIGGKPGQVMTLDNALHILLVKSANDVAVLIAEGVAGSVEQFADMMNEEASRLGMRESRFVNPNGLHAVGQQSSARDMAVLARALLRDFPEYKEYFGVGAVRLGNRVMKNTNGLIGRYPGADGMKTGFICPSGFNVVATATRGGRQLIAVVFGSASATERTIKAAALFDKGFATSTGFFTRSQTLDELPPSGITTAPNMREEICLRKGVRQADDDGEAVPDWTAAAPSGNSEDGGAQFFLRQAQPSPAAAVAQRDQQGRRTLGPRAEFDPIVVSFGPTAGSAKAPPAANRDLVPTALASRGKPAGAAAYAEEGSAGAPKVKPGSATPVALKAKAAAKPKAKPPVSAKVAPAKPDALDKAKLTIIAPDAAPVVPAKATPVVAGKPVPTAKPASAAKPVPAAKPASAGAPTAKPKPQAKVTGSAAGQSATP
jgi:D-alanyl-D-alanine carboxypeptidase